MGLREIGCEDERRMELVQDRVQWRALKSAVINSATKAIYLITYLPKYDSVNKTLKS
jgi:hypothetical protein